MSEQEALIKEKDDQIETLTKERDELKEAQEKAEKDKLIAEAQKAVKEAVDQAELPDAAKARLIEQYKDAESADGIVESIQAEKDYIAKLSESGNVKGLGASKPENDDDEKSKKALKESYIRSGMSEADADVAVNGR